MVLKDQVIYSFFFKDISDCPKYDSGFLGVEPELVETSSWINTCRGLFGKSLEVLNSKVLCGKKSNEMDIPSN